MSIVAHPIETSQNQLYASERIQLKPKQLHNIDQSVTEAFSALKITKADNLPKIVIISHEEFQSTAVAAYNRVHNIMYIYEGVGKLKGIAALQDQFTCPNNKLSTYVHELLHWKDAERYRDSKGKLPKNYLEQLRLDCKKKLDRLEEQGYNIKEISDYASEKYRDKNFDETYTEYRVKELLKG